MVPTVMSVLRFRTFLRNRRETLRRRRVIEARQTDYRRWESRGSYSPRWGDRLATAMELIAESSWVGDLGCGMQELRKRLPPKATYLAMDLQKWTPDTLVCDINAKSLSDDYLALCDVCVMMGVLEYIYEPHWLFGRLAEHAESIVLSYNATDTSNADRMRNGWVNAFTSDDLLGMLSRTPYRITQIRFHGGQILIKAVNPDFGPAQEARREERRRAFMASAARAAMGAPADKLARMDAA